MGKELSLSHTQLRRQVTERLRAAILAGDIEPGEWLRQEHIAQQFGVSQMPVREAFKQLAAEGLLEHVPYHGVRVITFSAADVADLYAQRAFLEGRAARAAAEAIDAAELAQLADLLQQMRQCIEPAALVEYRRLNRQFHQQVAEASRRSYLIRALTQLWAAFPNMLLDTFSTTSAEALPQRDNLDPEEHAAILEALQRHDPDAAEQRMAEHILNAGEELVQQLAQA